MSTNSDLQQVKNNFEGTLPYGQMEVNITVRRRRMADRFCAEDLTFIMEFNQTGQNLTLLDCIISIHQSLKEMIRRLKEEFDNGMKRYCFFSCRVDQMTSSIHSGLRDLYEEPEDQLANSIMTPLLLYLASNKEARLDSNLEVKVTLCSLEHSAHQAIKKKKGGGKPLQKRPYPLQHKLGYQRTKTKKPPKFPNRHPGKILVPSGFPAQKNIFENRCMALSFCIGKMIYEAGYQGGKAVNDLLWQLKGLSGQRTTHVSKKMMNTIGEKIWKNVQDLMGKIKVDSLGPHTYQVLDKLCQQNGCQAIVYSGLLSEPAWVYPKDLDQTRPDLQRSWKCLR